MLRSWNFNLEYLPAKLFIFIISFSFYIALNVEGETLYLTKVTRSEMGAYLCIVSNGVPPSVSKRMKLQVHCKYTYIFSAQLSVSIYIAQNIARCLLSICLSRTHFVSLFFFIINFLFAWFMVIGVRMFEDNRAKYIFMRILKIFTYILAVYREQRRRRKNSSNRNSQIMPSRKLYAYIQTSANTSQQPGTLGIMG